jgi:hypothetical protein
VVPSQRRLRESEVGGCCQPWQSHRLVRRGWFEGLIMIRRNYSCFTLARTGQESLSSERLQRLGQHGPTPAEPQKGAAARIERGPRGSHELRELQICKCSNSESPSLFALTAICNVTAQCQASGGWQASTLISILLCKTLGLSSSRRARRGVSPRHDLREMGTEDKIAEGWEDPQELNCTSPP